MLKDLKCIFIGGVPIQMDSENGTVKAPVPSNTGLVTKLITFSFAVILSIYNGASFEMTV